MSIATPKTGAALPAPVGQAGVTGDRELDVRPVLARGGDPLHLVMQTLRAIGAREALHLVIGFEPASLCLVLGGAGYLHHTEQRAGLFHVWLYRAPWASTGTGGEADRAPLQPPVELDVRGLEPPARMVTILQTLADLGPGARLRVRQHREPRTLHDKLALRGYGARCTALGPADFVIDIAPAWAIDEGLA